MKRWIVITLLTPLLISVANSEDISIVTSANSAGYSNISKDIEKQILSYNKNVSVHSYNFDDFPTNLNKDITVSLGKSAFDSITNPNIASFVQSRDYPNKLNTTFVSIYPEPSSLIKFAQAISEQHYKQQIIVPISKGLYEQIHAARLESSSVKFIVIQENEKITKEIKPWLYKQILILAIPDDQIWSGNQAKWLLLNAYENQVPVIGYSKAFLKAGAMASIYVEKEKVIECIAELATRNKCDSKKIQNVYYPKLTHSFNTSITDILKFNPSNFEWK